MGDDGEVGRGRHVPVLLAPMLEALAVRPGGAYLDATFGGGGYSRALLDAGAGRVLGLDRDPAAVARGRELAAAHSSFTMLHGPFGAMEEHLGRLGITRLDGIVLDLGVSSMQLEDPGRGFSFQRDGPLDMRMSGAGMSAADLVNTVDEAALADLIWRYGEERASRRVARAIVQHRARAPFRTTLELAQVVKGAVGRHSGGIDPATRTFQALRIQVNDELGELERALAAAERLLAPGGRLVVIAFHSLEDRLVKRFMTLRSGGGVTTSRHRPEVPAAAPTFRLVTRRPLRPGAEEVARNPRARSARLRAAERLAGPADAP